MPRSGDGGDPCTFECLQTGRSKKGPNDRRWPNRGRGGQLQLLADVSQLVGCLPEGLTGGRVQPWHQFRGWCDLRSTRGYRIRTSFAFNDFQRKLLPPLPLFKLTLSLLPVSPASAQINAPSAIHRVPQTHFFAASRCVTIFIRGQCGRRSQPPPQIPASRFRLLPLGHSLTGRNRPQAVIAICNGTLSKEGEPDIRMATRGWLPPFDGTTATRATDADRHLPCS